MLNPKAICVCAILVAGCSGKTELAGEGVPGKQPSSPTTTTTSTTAKHLLMVVQVEPDAHKLTVLSARNVELPLPKRRVPERGEWRAEVLGADGAVLYTAELPDAAALRGEFPGPDGQIQGVHLRASTTAVTLRLPLLPAATTVRLVDASAPGAGVEIARMAYPVMP